MLFEWREEKDKLNRKNHEMPLKAKLLYVVYTERGEGTIRLISVRKATKHELRLYQSGGY